MTSLANQARRSSLDKIASIFEQVYTCQMTTSGTIVQHITKILNMALALGDLNEKISDESIIAKLLESLQEK